MELWFTIFRVHALILYTDHKLILISVLVYNDVDYNDFLLKSYIYSISIYQAPHMYQATLVGVGNRKEKLSKSLSSSSKENKYN